MTNAHYFAMRLSRSASSSYRAAVAEVAEQKRAGPKIVVVGDGGVGKTSLLTSFVTGSFPREYVPTVFENHQVERVVDGEPVLLEIWDTAGQEEYANLRQRSYANADIVLIVFAIDNRDSFENVQNKWMREVMQHCATSNGSTGLIVVGSKADLREDEGILAEQASYGKPILEASEYADRLRDAVAGDSVEKYLECSALNSEGLEELFQEVVRVYRRIQLSATTIKAGEKEKARVPAKSKSQSMSCVLI